MARFVENGAVELYHDNFRSFRTDANGASVFGPEGGNAELHLYADEGDDNADCWRLLADTNGDFKVGNKSTGSYVYGLKLTGSGNAEVNNNLSIGGNLTVDSSTFYVDATNNRVAVGTTTEI